MTDNGPAQDLTSLRNRIQWVDDERRRTNKRLAELEQRLELQAREIASRDERIKTLEEQLANVRGRVNSISDYDERIKMLRAEMVGLIDKNDTRRRDAENEAERMRRTERQALTREIADIRKELPLIPRLQNDLEQRRAEEARLSKMIAALDNRFPPYDARIDTLDTSTSYVSETVKQLTRQLSELQSEMIEHKKRFTPLQERLDGLNRSVARHETTLQTTVEAQSGIDRQIKDWIERLRSAEYERNQRVGAWEQAFDTYKADMQRFHKDWMRYIDQTKDVNASLQSLAEWRKQIELQQREVAELTRVELQRNSTRWDQFLNRSDKTTKTLEVEAQQRQAAIDRRQKQFSEQLHALYEQLTVLRREKDTLYRIQTAQADAIKRIPSLWVDEVEKAISNDPNRRRSAALTPTPDEQ